MKESFKKEVIGILLAVIMMGSVFSMITHLTTGSDVTQTTVRNSYVVNPDNVTISIDGNTSSVLIGQNVQFMYGGNKTGTVPVTGVEGTPAEGYVVTSDSTGWLDTSWMVEGMYNATHGEHWELLAVSKPVMGLSLKVGTKEVTSIAQRTPLRLDFESRLDENDCVDLRIVDPDGIKLTQNPADPDQKFDDINVSQLLEYGSMNESKQINTTGWKVGTYRFSVRTEEENARGLDVCSGEIKLDVYKCGIWIEAEKTKVVKLEKVKLRVAGCLYHNITINSSDPAHTLFPAGYADNPPYDTSGFNDIIDSPDGEKEYVVYFSETGTYTIMVRDTTADSYDSADIKVLGNISFDVPSICIIGRKLPINGTATSGNSVDIAIDDIIKAVDVPIENNTFYTETSTESFSSGTITIKGFIDGYYSLGENVKGEPCDGSIAVLIIEAPQLYASISKSTVAPGDSFEVYGNASSDYIEIVTISPRGGNGTGMEGLYGVSIYTVPAFKPWTQPEAGGNLTTDEPLIINNTANRENGTIVINVTGPEDDIDINVTEKAIKFNIPSTYVIGENLTINGTANAGTSVDIAIDDIVKTVDIPIENGTFHTDISTAGYIPGSYLIEGFIDRNFSVGEDISGEESDGSTIIIIPAPDLTANLSTNIAQPGETLVINGTATGTDHVDIITITPFGGNGTGLYEKSYPGVPGITTESIPVENNSFSKIINVSEHADVGKYVIWVSVPGRDGYYGDGYGDNASDIINHIIDDYCGGDVNELRSKTQEQILDMLKDATINMAGSDDLACIKELTVGHLSYNYDFYKRIKVDTSADTGNYTILVLSPGRDSVYGISPYKYIDNILDLDGAGPEPGVIDVSNKTQHEIVSIVKDVTIDQGGSDDLLWAGHLTVYQPKIIYVDDNFEDDPANHTWNTIQEGINDASYGDTIIVRDGTYVENVDVNKRLTIKSENGSALTIVQAANPDDHVFEITTDSVNISGFAITGTAETWGGIYHAGIYLNAVDRCNISNNIISNNTEGIWLYYSNKNTIEKNNASSNYCRERPWIGCGIELENSNYNQLMSNTANSNYAGILMHLSSNHNTLVNNTVKSNGKHGIEVDYSSFNSITRNNVSLNNHTGVVLHISSNNLIYNNYFGNNTNNACEGGNNVWNVTKTEGTNIIGGTYLGGNYWSDYAGEDTDGDGLGDTLLPYNSFGNITNGGDWLPLKPAAPSVFGTSSGTYPSISGTHNGTIKPNHTVIAAKLYTYPCPGTGGHTEHIKIWNTSNWNVTATWDGYTGDWHNVSFNETFVLYKNEEYNYTIKTGSYPQIIHNQTHTTLDGSFINCTEFTDANGKRYNNWIPAIKLLRQ